MTRPSRDTDGENVQRALRAAECRRTIASLMVHDAMASIGPELGLAGAA